MAGCTRCHVQKFILSFDLCTIHDLVRWIGSSTARARRYWVRGLKRLNRWMAWQISKNVDRAERTSQVRKPRCKWINLDLDYNTHSNVHETAYLLHTRNHWVPYLIFFKFWCSGKQWWGRKLACLPTIPTRSSSAIWDNGSGPGNTLPLYPPPKAPRWSLLLQSRRQAETPISLLILFPGLIIHQIQMGVTYVRFQVTEQPWNEIPMVIIGD